MPGFLIGRGWCILLAAMLLAAGPGALQGQSVERAASIEARMRAFLTSNARRSQESAAAFFPRSGAFTWMKTSHLADRDVVGVWRFRAADFRAAYHGPLWDVLNVDQHGQRVGSLSHQIVVRRSTWRRVRGNRFVPTDALDASPVFVQWRREGGQWVISAVGDESYKDAPLPAWCC
jgi:hypothetical protein